MPEEMRGPGVLGSSDLVITASTLGNPSFPVLVGAAAAAGFSGLSIWPEATYGRAREEGFSDADMHAMLADNGLVVQDVDPLIGWVGPDDPGPPYLIETSRELLFDAANALGASFVNVLLVGSPEVSLDDNAAVFAGLCDLAAEHGLTATLEFFYRGVVKDITQAAAVVRSAGRPNGKILFDTWHNNNSGLSFASLNLVPGDLIAGVQINDAPGPPPSDMTEMIKTSMHHRLPPGDGVLDLVDFLRTLRAVGCVAPLTIEVFNDELLASLGPDAFAQSLGDAVRNIVETAAT